jgi:hypothetical protein
VDAPPVHAAAAVPTRERWLYNTGSTYSACWWPGPPASPSTCSWASGVLEPLGMVGHRLRHAAP